MPQTLALTSSGVENAQYASGYAFAMLIVNQLCIDAGDVGNWNQLNGVRQYLHAAARKEMVKAVPQLLDIGAFDLRKED